MKSTERLFEEINNLKNIINIKNKELEKYKNIYLNKKIILFVGEKNVGKTTIISNINKIIKEKNKYELKEIDINNYLNIEEIGYNQIIGKVIKRIPVFGLLLQISQNKITSTIVCILMLCAILYYSSLLKRQKLRERKKKIQTRLKGRN